MAEMIAVGLASSALATAYLAWRRHYRGQLLLLAGAGWVLFFVGLAAAFQVPPYGPQLFLIGCIVGAVIQRASDSARRRPDVGVEDERPTA
jgi:4-hydroxybenzoate polyprenyltransferase